jgi:hypothetical protein
MGSGRPNILFLMADHKEYFAELTEALFGKNDFEPFTREELVKFDPEGCAVVAKAWGLGAEGPKAPGRTSKD